MVRIWDIGVGAAGINGSCRWVLSGHELSALAVALSPDDRLLASGERDGTVFLWDPRTGTRRGELPHHRQAVLDLAFSPDGRTLVTGCEDGAVRVWQLAGAHHASV
jgi:WD40 repeat protein